LGSSAYLKTGTDRRINISLPEVVTLNGDGDGGFSGPHNEEAGVPSSDVELTPGPGASKDVIQRL
jgi:hypothetical protein